MKYELRFHCDLTEEQSQTCYDAMHEAIWKMKDALRAADSNDDLAAVFVKTEFVE